MYDLIIVGGGPAGVAAAVYAARKQLKTLFITNEWGGQSIVSPDIQNWIGTPSISGSDLAKQFRSHVESVAGDILTILSPRTAISLSKTEESVSVTDNKGDVHMGKTLFIATGSNRKKLQIPGADIYDQKGLTYCASCDGPLYTDQDVAVVGGGNAGFETAAQLLAYAKSVTLFNRTNTYRADPITVQKVLSHPNIRAINNAEPVEILGEKFVTGMRYKDVQTGEDHSLPVTGIFVEIGHTPNTDWVKDTVATDDMGRIIVDPRSQRTSEPNIWAAGDCTDAVYHQNNIATGDAVKALEHLYSYLHAR